MSRKAIYSEDGAILHVEVLEDLSDDVWESYRLRVIAIDRPSPLSWCDSEVGEEFTCTARKEFRHMVDWSLR